MSISSALSVATSGLRATSVQTDLISRNIANASTEGYTRKSAELMTRQGGVIVQGVTREVDGLLDRLDRSNISASARADTMAAGLKSYTDMLGQPDDESSPAAGIGKLYTALVTLSGTPNAGAAQLGVIEAASVVAKQVSNLAATASELAREVELNIRYDVADLNDRLGRIGQINARLLQSGGSGVEGAELQDELGRLLDEVSTYLDIQTTSFTDGAVNVYTTGGTELVQGRRTTTISYDPGRSALMAGEVEITPGKAGVRGFSTGTLAGLFELGQTAVPRIHAELDAFAGMLIERFTAADPTLAPGEAGLFTDSAASTAAAGSGNLSSRLVVNPRLLASEGGEAGRLVSGLGSLDPLEPGSTTLLQAMMRSLDSRPAEPSVLGVSLSITDFAGTMVASQQQMRVAAESASEAARISGATISASRQNLQGVNVDDELQKLLLIEQSFAANAKVLTTVQSMLDTLLSAT